MTLPTLLAPLSNNILSAYTKLVSMIKTQNPHEFKVRKYDGTVCPVSIAELLSYQIGWGSLKEKYHFDINNSTIELGNLFNATSKAFKIESDLSFLKADYFSFTSCLLESSNKFTLQTQGVIFKDCLIQASQFHLKIDTHSSICSSILFQLTTKSSWGCSINGAIDFKNNTTSKTLVVVGAQTLRIKFN